MVSSWDKRPPPPLRGPWGWTVALPSMLRLASSPATVDVRPSRLVSVSPRPLMHGSSYLQGGSRFPGRAPGGQPLQLDLHHHRQDDGPALGAFIQKPAHGFPHGVLDGA